jgi:hypothetical protein
MLQPFFDFVEKFATDFSWKRLVISISLVLLVGAVFFLFESQTATYQLSKYERAVFILEKLESLSHSSDEEKKVIKNIYLGLTGITEPSASLATFTTSIPIEIKQALLELRHGFYSVCFLSPVTSRETKMHQALLEEPWH